MAFGHLLYKELLFKFEGRIPRSTFWLRYALPWIAIFYLLGVVDSKFGTFRQDNLLGALQVLFLFVTFLPSIAVCVKRLHDRDRSGWLIVLLWVPILNFWPIVEMGLIRGAKGMNIYGPDPLGGD